jgi:hypothetical protein
MLSMTDAASQILLIEADSSDFSLRSYVSQEQNFGDTVTQVESIEKAIALLDEQCFDVACVNGWWPHSDPSQIALLQSELPVLLIRPPARMGENVPVGDKGLQLLVSAWQN